MAQALEWKRKCWIKPALYSTSLCLLPFKRNGMILVLISWNSVLDVDIVQSFFKTPSILLWLDRKFIELIDELSHDKTNKMVCAPSEDSDQPGHPPSLTRVFAVCLKKPWVLSYPLSTQRRLWSDWFLPLCKTTKLTRENNGPWMTTTTWLHADTGKWTQISKVFIPRLSWQSFTGFNFYVLQKYVVIMSMTSKKAVWPRSAQWSDQGLHCLWSALFATLPAPFAHIHRL